MGNVKKVSENPRWRHVLLGIFFLLEWTVLIVHVHTGKGVILRMSEDKEGWVCLVQYVPKES